ncbi:hypothetical protein TELCIR_04571 [Teladorsagia circumcincta]|uniref:Uncharacterized protein n=1 Tax=Teladorsagia circumcincta TaxID=45464 RepID=A0A2G9UT83_TELCI|nr:hypothetical protein TELCIR_04571 [Teladorsagia circumcincta]
MNEAQTQLFGTLTATQTARRQVDGWEIERFIIEIEKKGLARIDVEQLTLDAIKVMYEFSVSRSGIVTLYKRFLSLATHRDKETNEHFLTEIDFQSIAELQQNPLGQRIIDAFFADADAMFTQAYQHSRVWLTRNILSENEKSKKEE